MNTLKFENSLYIVLFVFLVVVGTASAAPLSYQQYYPSAFEFGDTSSDTTELITYKEDGINYVVELATDSPVTVYQVSDFGVFSETQSFAQGSVDGASGDFNNDNIIDLVLCYTSGSGQVWFGQGSGSFGNAEPFVGCNGLSVGQLDGQNGSDIVVATNTGIRVFVHDPANPAIFNLSQTIHDGVAFNDVTLGKISYSNGSVDSPLDFFAVSDASEEVWIGTNNGTFSLDTSQTSLLTQGNKVELADIDGDGDDEVFIVSDTMGHAYKNNDGIMSIFIIPNFQHASKDVDFGDFDDEEGLDIFFVGEIRSWFYTGVDLQDWGQEFIGGSSVVALDLDADNDDDFVIGRSGASNVPFKGGPNRVTIGVSPVMYNKTLEQNQLDFDTIQFNFSGNANRRGLLSWEHDWIVPEITDFNRGPSWLGSTWTLDFSSDGLLPGIYTDTIQIITNDPENELVHIPVKMTVTGAELEITPSNLALDTSLVAGLQTEVVSVTNTGTASVYVTPSDNTTWMSLNTTGFTLNPGESVEITVAINPLIAQVGNHQAQILLTPNKSYLDQREVWVELKVTGSQIFLPTITN